MKYTVLNVTKDSSSCPDGRQHISGARMTPYPSSVLAYAPVDKLLAMQQDSFVAPNPENVHEDVPVVFEPCPCGGGYVVVPAGVVEEL